MRIARVGALAVLAAVAPLRAQPMADLFDKVKDTVVVIRTVEQAPQAAKGYAPASQGGLGSGVLISKDGRVLTAAHVVQVAERIVVQLPGGEALGAKVVASAPSADIALLQLERPPMSPAVAPLGDSDRVRVGDEIIVVGAPLGMAHSLSAGHVGGRRTVNDLFGGFIPADLLQTDAVINEGNSGGPMFDMDGKVIGIVSHTLSAGTGSPGLGFVVTINMAKELLLSGGSRWSGLEGYLLDGDLARAFNLPQRRGILVQRVAKGSPAAQLGLRAGTERATIGGETFLIGGDVILAVMGIDVSDPDSGGKVRAALDAVPPGRTVSVVVLRDGRTLELEAKR